MTDDSDRTRDLDYELSQLLRRQSPAAFPADFTASVVARHQTRRREHRHTVLLLRLVGVGAVALAGAGALAIVPPAGAASLLTTLWHAAADSHVATALLLGVLAEVLSVRLAPRTLRSAT